MQADEPRRSRHARQVGTVHTPHATATKGDAHMLSVMIRPSKTRVVYAGESPGRDG